MLNNYFEEGKWSRIRAFNNKQRLDMRATPIEPLQNDSFVCLPAEEETKAEGRPIWQIGFEWDQPRDIKGVEIDFDESFNGNLIKEQYVEYWIRTWPTAHKDVYSGARRGWIGVDDAYNGSWTEAFGNIKISETSSQTIFDHVDQTEVYHSGPFGEIPAFNNSEDYNAFYRRTLKLRVMFDCEIAPVIKAFRLIGNATVETKTYEIYSNVSGKDVDIGCDALSIWNGEIKSLEKIDNCIVVKCLVNTGVKSDGDVTILQIDGRYPFGVNVADIPNGVYMEDFDILVTTPLGDLTPIEKIKELTDNKRSIFDRIPNHFEQTRSNAFEEVPELKNDKQPPFGRYVILGWDGLRKKFCLRYNGDIFADKLLQKSARRDLAGTRWAGSMLHFCLSTGDPPDRREGGKDCRQHMPDAAVPIYVTEWIDREIEYKQTSFATLRDTLLIGSHDLKGDEDIVILNRIEIRNASADTHVSRLYVELYPGENLKLIGNNLVATGRVVPDNTVQYGWRVQKYNDDCMRLAAKPEKGELRCIPKVCNGVIPKYMYPGNYYDHMYYDGPAINLEATSSIPGTLLHEVELGSFETCTIDFVIPYNTPTECSEMEAVSLFDFDEQKELITEFWRNFYKKASVMELPDEKHINDFMKAVPWHIIMTAMREPTTGNYIVPAATYSYMACGNEACMQIRLMDYLGYHDFAEKYLDAYVNGQGTNGLDGNFSSKEGALVAVNYGGRRSNDDQFAYNLDHGYILWCFADHYMLTGDKEWLKRVSKTIVDGCEFVFREREANKKYDENGEKVSYYGLMPHGHLEDNKEWRCWFAVNGHACGGIIKCAKALADINHPEAERIMVQAMLYKSDIRDNVIRCMSKSPAVPNGKGGYMPHIPTQAEIRGRDWGWFREACYGPLHLVTGLVLDPKEDLTTWILRDLEDNLFISRDYGRISDKEKYWFSQGGNTIQSNLLFNDIVYLERNEPERALRSLFNNFAQNLYRDMNCFTEHPVPEFGHGIGPFFKISDEAQFLVNLRNHLVREDDKSLLLLQAASREWFAPGKKIKLEKFASGNGPVSIETESYETCIKVTIDGDWRNSPEQLKIYLRRPDKKSPVEVVVNGNEVCPYYINGDEIIIDKPAENLEIIAKY